MSDRDKDIIFFDGICGFCNRMIRIVLRLDKAGRFFFAPIEGETWQALLGAKPKSDSFVVYEGRRGGQTLIEAEACLFLGRSLGKPWSWAAQIGACIPKATSTAIYRFIARHRYQIADRHLQCPVPEPEFSGRFLP